MSNLSDEDDSPPHKQARYLEDDKMESSGDDNRSNSEHDNEDKDDYESDDVESTQDDKSNLIGKSFQSGLYSNIASRLMSKMGYVPGKGLGKKEDGIVDPVQASTQKGRRGLGIEPSVLGEVPKDFPWKPDDDDIKPEIREEVLWMPSPPSETLSRDLLIDWLKEGVKKLILDDEKEFVTPRILQGVLQTKTCFDELHEEDLRNARFRSNPYETIGASIFLNRAAMKMANMDSVFNYMFTNPYGHKRRQDSLEPCHEILYFADVCAGPGGFSEYVLFRRGWTAKGFGFTLKSSNDFKLADFYAGTPETFNPYYGVADDGNIYDPDNLSALKEHVLKNTDDKGVHFLMADGGFSTKGQENIQEILSKQLYLCQCLAALMLVRTGGHFVVKLFDVFTPFSVGLIYIMYRCFEKVCIHKPVTSRPANSERYLICKGKKLETEAAEQHLFSVNKFLWRERDSDRDITQLVPLSEIKNDKEFFDYIYKSNDMIGENQIKNLLKIAKYCEDKKLKNPYQNDIKKECLELWNIPDRVRTKPVKLNYDEALSNIMGMLKIKPPEAHDLQIFKNNIIGKPPIALKSADDLTSFESVYDWYFMFLESKEDKEDGDLMVILATGSKQVVRFKGRRWEPLQLNFVIPANTLLYGELVRELTIQDKTTVYKKVFHVIDALILGGRDISYHPLSFRRRQCEFFCTALHNPFLANNEEITPIRCKRLLNMEKFSNEMLNLEVRSTKRVREAVTLRIPRTNNYNEEIYLIVGSILFMKEIKDPWQAKMSRRNLTKYYHNRVTQKPSVFYLCQDAIMDTFNTYISRIKWNWADAGVAILNKVSNQGLTLNEIEDYIEKNK